MASNTEMVPSSGGDEVLFNIHVSVQRSSDVRLHFQSTLPDLSIRPIIMMHHVFSLALPFYAQTHHKLALQTDLTHACFCFDTITCMNFRDQLSTSL